MGMRGNLTTRERPRETGGRLANTGTSASFAASRIFFETPFLLASRARDDVYLSLDWMAPTRGHSPAYLFSSGIALAPCNEDESESSIHSMMQTEEYLMTGPNHIPGVLVCDRFRFV